MPTSTISGAVLEASEPAQHDVLDEFELDVRVIIDAAAGYDQRGCDTSDGCATTCASACASS